MNGLALVLAAHVATGGVVDVSAGAEARGTQLASPDGDLENSALTGSFVLRPAVSGALESDRGAVRAGYAPQLSFVTPASQLFLLLHTADASGDLVVGPRFRLRGGLTGAIGDLDPAGAQSTLQGSSAVLAPLVSLPFATAGARAGALGRLTRTLELDVEGRADTTQSPGDETLPATHTAAVDATLAWQVSRMDGALFGLRTRVSAIDGRGSFSGGAPVVGWRRLLGRRAGLDVLAGAGPYYVEAGDAGAVVVWVPTAEARLNGVFDLAGDAALELIATGSLGAVADPLGALLEERAAASGGIIYRITRALAVRASVGGFGPLLTVGRPPNDIASTSLTSSGGIAWTLSDHLALEGGLLGTTRRVADRFVTDVTLSVAVVGQTNVLHTGGRPAGSDARLGHAIGETRIGAAPPPNRSLLEEEPPPLDVEAVEPPPPELEPPPGYVPEEVEAMEPTAPPSSTPSLRRERPEEAKKAGDDEEEDEGKDGGKDKKKRKNKTGADAGGEADDDDAAASRDLVGPP